MPAAVILVSGESCAAENDGVATGDTGDFYMIHFTADAEL
jgi:hypothetical protein